MPTISKDNFIGVDVGTTSTKVIVFSSSGTVKAMSKHGYSLQSPKPGWAEQDPEAIFTAVITGMREAIEQADVSTQTIAAVGISTAMHSLIAVDHQHKPLTQSIVWADNRSVEQAERLKRETGLELYQRTGTPIHPMSPLTKLIWMREQQPDTFGRAAKFISIKEYILYKLFDRYIVDYSIASATGLLNLESLDWDQDALERAGIGSERLSELVPTTHVLRGMKTEYAEATGLHPDTPVVIGAGDGMLTNLGVGAMRSDQLAITIGTSGTVHKLVSHPVLDSDGRTFCYVLTENQWIVGGASNNGGIALQWFQNQFAQADIEQAQQQQIDPYEFLIQTTEAVSAGADGLLFLPFLSGERAPYWNPDARGVFFGTALHHERAHFTRSVLEGILFAVYSITEVLDHLTGESKTIVASGGFARSKPWLQMMADLFGEEVWVPEVYEASGFGAAVLAMVAIGALRELTDVQPLIQMRDCHPPNLELSQRYHALFQIYKRVYSHLLDEFAELADYQRQYGTP